VVETGTLLAAGEDFTVRELPDPSALATVLARHGQRARLQAFLAEELPQRLPAVALLRNGPGQWLALTDDGALAGEALQQALMEVLGSLASVCDQTASRARFAVSGARARELLGKGAGLDLHPSRFAAGDVAVTGIAHIGAQLWQVDETPTYQLLVARSFAGSFSLWLRAAAASLGAVAAARAD
jgi:methylglutamate dehydrogenase subunit D